MITILIKNLQKKIPIDQAKIKRTVLKIISKEGLPKNSEVNLSFISDARIKRLNSLYHGRDSATDVLAFDLGCRGKQRVCDIYISADTAVRNSRRYSSRPAAELLLYVIHAMLHIAGYDDHKSGDIELMRKKEQVYLNGHN